MRGKVPLWKTCEVTFRVAFLRAMRHVSPCPLLSFVHDAVRYLRVIIEIHVCTRTGLVTDGLWGKLPEITRSPEVVKGYVVAEHSRRSLIQTF